MGCHLSEVTRVLLYYPLKWSIKNVVQKSVIHIQTNEHQLSTVLTGASVDISTSGEEICYITGQFDTFLWGLLRGKVVCCHFVGPFLDCLSPDKLGKSVAEAF